MHLLSVASLISTSLLLDQLKNNEKATRESVAWSKCFNRCEIRISSVEQVFGRNRKWVKRPDRSYEPPASSAKSALILNRAKYMALSSWFILNRRLTTRRVKVGLKFPEFPLH